LENLVPIRIPLLEIIEHSLGSIGRSSIGEQDEYQILKRLLRITVARIPVFRLQVAADFEDNPKIRALP
jgi:hypothetical protein